MGGGAYLDNASNIAVAHGIALVNARMSGNSAIGGAGLWVENGVVHVANALMTDNEATSQGGAIYGHQGTLLLYSSTIAQNKTELLGTGIFVDETRVEARNSLLWGRQGTKPVVFSRHAAPDTTSSWVDDGTVPIPASFFPGAGGPPLDTGATAWLPADIADLDGDGDVTEPLPLDYSRQPRVVGAAVDLGCFEAQTP
jgi:predicted outer membrane repeat protein